MVETELGMDQTDQVNNHPLEMYYKNKLWMEIQNLAPPENKKYQDCRVCSPRVWDTTWGQDYPTPYVETPEMLLAASLALYAPAYMFSSRLDSAWF